MLVQPPFPNSSEPTLVELLRWRALRQPEQQAYTFLIDGEAEGSRLSYLELDCQARAIGTVLQQRRAQGERALLLYPPGLEFIAAFFGSLYGGVIAIPAPPPDAARLKRTLPRLQAIAHDAQASLILTTSRILAFVEDICLEVPEFQTLQWLATEQISRDLATEWQEPAISRELAYLQYTSGSTAMPKGVMVSHGNVMHHCADIKQAWHYTSDSIAATWMPYFHDYGLVDGLIQPLYSGIPCFILSPLTFIRRPLRWLQTISRYRVTHSQGPNFAYEHCVRRITPDQCGDLDLSGWQTASNGAEPIRKTTLDQFVAAFEPFGFCRRAFYPAYGLAEATLLVSTQGRMNQLGTCTVQIDALGQNQVVKAVEGQFGVQTLISCGCPIGTMQVVIADPQTMTQCEPDQVGEVWISDPSVAQGYWNRPQETQQTFHAYLAGTGQGPFLRTGDLGFLQDGELFITSRLKDLIIIRGRNHYPQDIELTVEQSHPALRPNCGAAFSVEIDAEERLVIAQEIERRSQKLEVEQVVGVIRQAVAEHHELEVHAVLLLKPGSIPKTSSGKIQRQACCTAFLNGSLELLAHPSSNPVVALNFKKTVTTPALESQNQTAPKPLAELHGQTRQSTRDTKAIPRPNRSQERADQLIDWLRSYANNRINSHLIDERRCIPPYIVLDLGNQGILGMQVPEAYGGIALNNIDAMRVVEQLAAIDLTIATFVCINNFLGIRPVQRFATEALRTELLPSLAQGRELAAFALTEPGAGSNPRAISAKAISDGQGGWQLQGTKIWSGSAAWAGLINVFVQMVDADGKPNGTAGFVVPQGTPGLRMGPEALTMGMRGVVQNALYLENAPINSANLLGEPSTGMDVAQDAMLFTRLAIAAMSIGGLKRCTQLMLRYATRRSVGTGRLLDNPVTLARISDLTAATTALSTLVTRMAELLDDECFIPVEAYIACKTSGPEFLWQAADNLVQLFGGRGYIETNIAPQILRDARVFRIFEGPTETLNMFLGSRMLHNVSELYQFLSNRLEAPAVSDKLSDAIARINARWLASTAPFPDRPSALRWASLLTGEVTVYAILLAAVQGAVNRTPSSQLHRAVQWVQQQFDQTLTKALTGTPPKSVLLDADEATELVSSYTDTIGDLEQTLAGEDDRLDELLRREHPTVASPSLVKDLRDAVISVQPSEPDQRDKGPRGQGDAENVSSAPQLPSSPFPSTESVQTWLAIWISKELRIQPESIDTRTSFFHYGLDSVTIASLTADLEDWLGRRIPPTLAWDYPSIEALVQHLILERPPNDQPQASSDLPPILPGRASGPIPLSYGQQRLWFLHQLEPSSPTYNHSTAIRFNGSLDATALEQSLNEIVRRHETLRTTFVAVEGQPVQTIASELTLPLSVVDLTELPETERQAKVLQLAVTEAQRSFDLSADSLIRTVLLRVNQEEYMLLLTIHHIATDGWSMEVLFQELATLYTAFCLEQPSPLSELPIQYANFTLWQRQWLKGSVLEDQLAYWRRQLDGAPSLELPTDYLRPAIQTFQGGQQSLVLTKRLTEALKRLSQREGVTLFMTLLAAFQTLLYRYTGQEDVVIGSPVSGRNRSEIERLIGFFVNNLVLRTDLSGNPSFQELLRRVRQTVKGAYTHQDLPFEKLVEELQPERSLSRHPVFDVMLNFSHTSETALQFPGLNLSFLELTELESKFSITLYVEEQKSELSLQLVYQRALFSPKRMTSLLNQFQYLLEQVIAAPENPIRHYSLVTPESRPLLPDPTAVLLEPEYELLTTTFAGWVRRMPEQTAVCQGELTWTYRTLAERANVLAHELVAQGLKQGEVVAVSGCRSFGLIASMMAVLLAGAVLLTIDRNLPRDRQTLMLREAKAAYLLYITDHRPVDEWRQESSLKILSIDPKTGQPVDLAQSSTLKAIGLPELSPNDAAYIFFTSGTTGVPKGVLGCHKGLSHFLNWQQETFAVGPNDRVAQLTSLSFDVVLRDVFLPLISGATLCLPEGDDLGASQLIRWLDEQQISLLHTVPSVAQSWLVNSSPGASLQALRWVFFAGEPLTDKLVHQWREHFSQIGGIINLYGPTEITLAKCFYQIPFNPSPGIQPVGLPLPTTQALILAGNQLCGIGELGQIVLRTPFRSLGYINTPEDHQKGFVKNSFRDDNQDLLYYTGDLGRYRPDGLLEILGRLDHQVKIHGVRIELGEIETVLGQHPEVRQTVVTARDATSGDKRLVAYIVPYQPQSSMNSKLRSFLKQKLPEFMVPSAFVLLDALPLSSNGKVDRQVLPAPNWADPELARTFVAPQDPLELQLRMIWERVLGIQPISTKDNFFDLGGHSLLAVQAFAQIEKTFGKQLSLATLFQAPTIEQLGNILRSRQVSVPAESLVPLQPIGNKPPLFCIYGILLYHDLALNLGTDQPVYGVYMQNEVDLLKAGELDKQQTALISVTELATLYLRQIQALQPMGPYFLAGESFGGLVAFEMAQQLQAQGEKVALLALFDTTVPGSLEKLPVSKRGYLHLKNLLEEGHTYALEKIRQRLNLDDNRLVNIISKIHRKLEQGRQLQPQPQESLPSDIRHQVRLQAFRSYVPQPYPGRVTLFQAMERSQFEAYTDPQWGWGSLAAGGLEMYHVPGDHIGILKEPHVKVLAEKLKGCLEQARRD